MPTYGQNIDGPDGSAGVMGCGSAKEAVAKATDLAMASGWHPPHWWEFWLPRWPEACEAEYHERMNGKPGPT